MLQNNTLLFQQRKMIQSEPLMAFWPSFSFTNTAFNHHDTPYDQEMLLDGFFDLENFDDDIHLSSALEGSIEEICEWINKVENEGNSFSPPTTEGIESSSCFSHGSDQNSIKFPSMVLPTDEMEVDDQLSLLHLLRAYGEATENGETELAEVIVKSINEKSSPTGTTMERVAYNLFLSREKQGEYLREESSKNLAAAFKVLYQSLPNGRLAHFTANSAILESVPHDVETVRIVEFDIGEGVQWPPLIEALSWKQKSLRLTSIKQDEDCIWSFEDTKRWLLAHAEQCGVNAQIEEKSTEEYRRELKGEMEKREWPVFNCMMGLPHMGRRRSRKRVAEFLDLAKEVLAISEGLVIVGDGEFARDVSLNSYASYFDNFFRHHQALFESLEMNFPASLAEARTAMESLFLAPSMSPAAWFRDWEERSESRDQMAGLRRRRVSRESLTEAKQMVDGREDRYNVKIEHFREHEMVLQWKEMQLVRISTWM